jgi:RNA polymerase sigma factor (sigma-70 family)
MNKIISLIAKDHKKWTRIVESFGANHAEDIVQEMYLKIHEWKGKYDKTLMYNETEINYFFVFKVLRNIFLDKVKKKKREFSLETNIVEPCVYDNTFEYIEKVDTIKKNISTWNTYDRKIYELVFIENKSMLELSKLTGIDYYSIYRTVKKINKLLINQIER